jgi:hypothetical protein
MPWRRSATATTDMTLVQILGELVQPRGKEGCMGELDHLMIMVAQMRRRFSRGQQRSEVWSDTDKVIVRFYLRAAISDCLLIGFIRATETLRKN